MRKAWQLSYNGVRTMLNVNTEAATAHNAAHLDHVHHEIELIVKINKVGKYIEPKFAHKYYDEISVGIDFTARDLQDQLKAKGLPWEKAKAFDHSAVIGAFLPKKELHSMENINFELLSNGQSVQKGNTELMLWNIDALVAYVSQFFTLKKGDIIDLDTVVPLR